MKKYKSVFKEDLTSNTESEWGKLVESAKKYIFAYTEDTEFDNDENLGLGIGEAIRTALKQSQSRTSFDSKVVIKSIIKEIQK